MSVVTHEKFGGTDTVERLRAAGVEVEESLTDEQVADIGLKEPQYGEAHVGECTPDEARLFHALWRAQRELEDATRNLMGRSLQKMGTSISESDRNRPLQELLQSGDLKMDFDNEEDGEVYFRLQQRAAHLHAAFYWAIGERLGKHQYRLGVRSRFRIVTVERRY